MAKLGVTIDEIKSLLQKNEEVKITKEEKHNTSTKTGEVEGKFNTNKRFEEVVKT